MIGADAEIVINGELRYDAENMLLLETDESKHKIVENPGSRELTCFDEKMRQSIVSLHQMDYDLLLLQVEVNEQCKHANSNKAKHQWILMTTEGQIRKLPALLEQILLKHKWKASSSSSNNELVNLVLTFSEEPELPPSYDDECEGGEPEDGKEPEEAGEPEQADL